MNDWRAATAIRLRGGCGLARRGGGLGDLSGRSVDTTFAPALLQERMRPCVLMRNGAALGVVWLGNGDGNFADALRHQVYWMRVNDWHLVTAIWFADALSHQVLL